VLLLLLPQLVCLRSGICCQLLLPPQLLLLLMLNCLLQFESLQLTYPLYLLCSSSCCCC
jgi:hypothetical protein